MIKTLLQAIVPEAIRPRCRRAWDRLKYFGLSRQCPVCGSFLRRFMPHGVVVRQNAVCPVCHARERNRIGWLYLERCTRVLSDPLTMLHIGPQPEVAKRLMRAHNLTYIPADLRHPWVLKMDLMRAPLRDASVDAVYCCHVLNALPDDRAAMREIYRMLRPGGWALVQVPLGQDQTEDIAAADERDKRLDAYGDPDIYRRYGPDLKARLEEAGFRVTEVDIRRTLTEREQTRFGLNEETLHVCEKAH